MATMLAVLPQEVKTVGAINYYKNNTYIVANDNKLYKYSGHSWDLFFDGDNYKDLHSQKINNFYFVNDQTILLAVAGNLFEYYRIESQLQAVKINTPAVNQEIEHIFDLNNNLYVAYQSNSAGESKSVLYKHINYNNYFEPLLHLRAEQINGGLVLSGLNSLCLFGTNIYEAGEDALPAAPAGNNFICIADDKNLTTVNGINSEVMAAFGFGSFK